MEVPMAKKDAPKKAEKVADVAPEQFGEAPERSMHDRRNDNFAPDEVIAVLGEDIDTRMDALLKDHQRMGARPK
jgi:hypothetical protein